jgi:hypothetical protein
LFLPVLKNNPEHKPFLPLPRDTGWLLFFISELFFSGILFRKGEKEHTSYLFLWATLFSSHYRSINLEVWSGFCFFGMIFAVSGLSAMEDVQIHR